MSRLTSWLTSRRIAIDLGDSSIKLLLAEADKRGVRVLRHRIIELKEEGLLSVEEVGRQLQAVLLEFGGHEIAVALPQRAAISQIVDLPSAADGEIQRLIERESTLLHARNESAMVYGFSPLKAVAGFHNPYWVAMAREDEVIQQILRLGGAEVAEVAASGNALITASLAVQPDDRDTILVELGARNTVLAILHQGQGVYATSFPLGSDSFTEAFAAERLCSFEEADLAKRTRDLFNGPAPSDALRAAIHRWIVELQKTVHEWFEAHPAIRPPDSLRVRLSGGGAIQPGLMEFLQALPDIRFEPWTRPLDAATDFPAGRFAVAYGTVLASFQRASQPASLLPEGMQFNRQTSRQLAIANWIGAAAIFVATLFVLGGLYQRWQTVQAKEAHIRRAQSILQQARQLETLLGSLNREQRQIQPFIDRQKSTVDLLQTLDLLRQARADRNIWFVLLADRQSYHQGSTVSPADTITNFINPPPSTPHRTFIAELCVPATGAETMKTLSDLVSELKQQPGLHNVDTLPASERQNRVDPKLIIPGRHFALAIELANLESNATQSPDAAPELNGTTNRTRGSGSGRGAAPPFQRVAERPRNGKEGYIR